MESSNAATASHFRAMVAPVTGTMTLSEDRPYQGERVGWYAVVESRDGRDPDCHCV
jgi:hypothetical protein